jgi:protein-S-isoprenylcysteine O-methyltransferase Ste14
MNHQGSAYGLWALVLINSAVFILFAYSFAKPATRRDWRSFGAFSAFLVALFAEMYGFPLTIYLLSGWLGSRFPGLDLFSHDAGHLWYTVIGFKGDPHGNPVHLLSNILILAGFVILYMAWKVLYAAQRERRLATTGPYARVRHPQYAGFILILFGFFLQWPTLLTLLMFPVLVYMYYRLSLREERESREAFGAAWEEYAACTPQFFPRLGSPLAGVNEVHKG